MFEVILNKKWIIISETWNLLPIFTIRKSYTWQVQLLPNIKWRNKRTDVKVSEVFDTADANAIEEVNLAYDNVREVDGLDITKVGRTTVTKIANAL